MSQILYSYEDTEIREASTSLKTLRVVNILSLIASFISSIYAYILDPREIDHKYNNIFSPSIVLILILWPLMYFLRFGFVFYTQFSNVAIVQEVVNESVGWLFTLANLFMLGWLWFWLQLNFVGSSFFATLTLMVVSLAHYRLTVYYPPNELPSSQAKKIYIFAHVPFAIYAAFSWLDLFHNIYMALLKSNNDDNYALLGILFVWIMGIIGFAWTVTGLFSNRQRDGLFGLAIAACLIDVAVREWDILYLSIQTSLLAGLIILSFISIYVKSGYKLKSAFSSQWISNPGSLREQAPLLRNQT
ncbi:8435_t:CDS:2 [Funneliformis geosporum]|uniref:7679_t:CDS:1 n=1 Tax=Funneliformis geosporum TaxID=1117311 RepID=A0A9W4SVW6_9GLOM|nr:8435_t:CDS:2 [Funneliformis geosporum]CAI2183467.1 7679_t:CDS:2 [Funneliformis geosporum]